jgi:hypothetical protein
MGSRGLRPWGTRQLNQALFTTLMAQFQGFCRDLHDEAVDIHVAHAALGQQVVLRTLMTQGRRLDVGNPRRSALAVDFLRLDVALLEDLKAFGEAEVRRLVRLDALVDFRNAVGHGNEVKIEAIERAGLVRATKRSYDQHRRSLEGLARAMDEVVSRRLAELLSIPRPW